MTGLRQKLNEIIQKNKYITLNEAYNFGASLGFKQKTVERELNPSRSPDIYTHRNHKGHITGYSFKPMTKPLEKIKTCCASFILFGEHARDCEQLKVNQPASLF